LLTEVKRPHASDANLIFSVQFSRPSASKFHILTSWGP